MKKEKKMRSTVLQLLLILISVYFITHFIYFACVIDGNSMEPNFHHSQNLIAQKVTYYFKSPQRFDTVIVSKENLGKPIIKRIIGLPYETVQICSDGTILINDTVLEENYGKEPIADAGNAINAITLSENEYFVLGDNRNNSSDSRFDIVGIVNQEEIIGKVWISFPF